MSMTHVHGHNKLVYNDVASDLAKAGAARSTVHMVSQPRGPAGGELRATRQKLVRAGGVKRQATVHQTSESDTSSDRPIAIRHRRRQMRNAPMDIPDPEPH